MHCRAGLYLVERQGDLRRRCAVPAGEYNGQTFLPGQANNFYIFPAVGMAIYATQAKRVTDEMFIEAGQAVADQVPSDLLNQGLLYPLQSNILETEIQTAARVAKLVFDLGLARVERPTDIVAFIRKHVYKPEYANSPAVADSNSEGSMITSQTSKVKQQAGSGRSRHRRKIKFKTENEHDQVYKRTIPGRNGFARRSESRGG